MRRHCVIVEGPLAVRTRRIKAARAHELGVDISTLPLVAARLAGGFTRPARTSELTPAIRESLAQGGFSELQSIRDLPGMPRATLAALQRLWLADLDLEAHGARNPRLGDLLLIERRVREALPPGALMLRDLRDAAIARIEHAPTVLGAVELDSVSDVAPLWRSLIAALVAQGPVDWRDGPGADWFKGRRPHVEHGVRVEPEYIVCATPRGEAIEALRWMRELIAKHDVAPSEIAICAPATEAWDGHFLPLAREADLPLHFSHGEPALATPAGQGCAALADVLLRGLSQARVRRLVQHARGRGQMLAELAHDWAQGLEGDAGLYDISQWRAALDRAALRVGARASDPRPLLIPVLELLARGADAAVEAGDNLLGAAAREVWQEALRRAPAQGLDAALAGLRIPDGRDPGASAVWCPANHLTGAPRKYVRLVGLTSRSWPRRSAGDALLPERVLAGADVELDNVATRDRHAFARLCACATGACVISRSRRDDGGRTLAVSPLISREVQWRSLASDRTPLHAMSEADRLLARPQEAQRTPGIARATRCWDAWRVAELTAHDGLVRAGHPLIAATDGVQSPVSLRLMLRDPLAWVWRYALGFKPIEDEGEELALDPSAYGDLVHEMLRQAVNALEASGGGYAAAPDLQKKAALDAALAAIARDWPLERPAPPPLLWRHTLDAARTDALKALMLPLKAGTRSWTEVQFGEVDAPARPGAPWPPNAEVSLSKSKLRLRGSIDRLDLNTEGKARVTEYKTGAFPPRANQALNGARELQLAVYAAAVRQLAPQAQDVAAQLLYLSEPRPRPIALNDIDKSIAALDEHASVALQVLARGACVAGTDAFDRFNAFRMALPATLDSYEQKKSRARSHALDDLSRVWSAR